MRRLGDRILLSATDLMRFMGCRHATRLDLSHLDGAPGLTPAADTEEAELLQTRGDAHERRHLDGLKARGLTVAEIPRTTLEEDVARTGEALASGVDVVFQGAFLDGAWGGWSDFLERVDRPSRLGPFSYEVTDTKLKRRPTPGHVLQLTLYSDMLAQVQGLEPEFAHVELGDSRRETLRLADFRAHARMARRQLERFLEDPEPTRAMPCPACTLCRWRDHCAKDWASTDSLFEVANMTRSQVMKLEATGISTMAALAAHAGRVPGMADQTLRRLRTQARLQTARKTGGPDVELWIPQATGTAPGRAGADSDGAERPDAEHPDAEDGAAEDGAADEWQASRDPTQGPAEGRLPRKGLALLPDPTPGDLFYDIEGDPHYEGGLEYLHGVWSGGAFRAFWAHDHAQERQALIDLLEFFAQHIDRYPEARIYHYASYEITALRRLTTRYGVGEDLRDRWLREGRFVDLYAVVRSGVITSEPSYSIKALEVFYGFERGGEVKTAGGSVVAYETWRRTRDQAILDEIESYNRADCISTQGCRDWLLGLRQRYGIPAAPPVLPADGAAPAAPSPDPIADIDSVLNAAQIDGVRRGRLQALARFHDREEKPGWWAIFDSFDRDSLDLMDEYDALASLSAISGRTTDRSSFTRTYRYPPQRTRLQAGDGVSVPGSPGGLKSLTVSQIDRQRRRITLKAGRTGADLLAPVLDLHPAAPIKTSVIRDGVHAVIRELCDSEPRPAIRDLLDRAAPRLTGRSSGPVLQGPADVAGVIDAVSRMDATVLPIQGPPGTGKTYVTAQAIVALLRQGRRVGVTSQAHQAIANVLHACLSAAGEAGLEFSGAHRAPDLEGLGYPPGHPVVCAANNHAPILRTAQLVGGTAFFFARDEQAGRYDWLFVDEAGQVSLANLVATGRAARNIVLVGDPRQLPMVLQAAHPDPGDRSCLEWLLGPHATAPAEAGIFLGETRRMHPDVCAFISENFYEGRLHSHPDTVRQRIEGVALPATGAWWAPVAHEGCSQESQEEVAAIRTVIDTLKGGAWVDGAGASRQVTDADIIVVAPYNAQVQALRDALPPDVRVGTVDRFQGQEAPVCLVSMTASSPDDVPRGIEFLLSANRINVAVSRARALAIVFGSPRLRDMTCSTIEQMRLVNVLCGLPDLPQV